MKKHSIGFLMIFFISIVPLQASTGKSITSDKNVYSLEAPEFFYNSFSQETQDRQESFKSFYLKQLRKIEKNEASNSMLLDLKDLLRKNNISLKIFEGESNNDLAAFCHDLNEEDFDKDGFLLEKSLQKIKNNGIKIILTAMNPNNKFSALFFHQKEGHQMHQAVVCQAPYCGRERTLLKDMEHPELGGIDVYEIGLTYVPFYIIQSHEFIHMQHFLETVDLSQKINSLQKKLKDQRRQLDPKNFEKICQLQKGFFCIFSELPSEKRAEICQDEWDAIFELQNNFDQILQQIKSEKKITFVQWDESCGDHILLYKDNILVDPKFIPYGLALKVKDFATYNKLLSPIQKKSFGEVVEFSDHIFLKSLFGTLCNAVRIKEGFLSGIKAYSAEISSLNLNFLNILQTSVREYSARKDELRSLLPQGLDQSVTENILTLFQKSFDEINSLQQTQNIKLSEILSYELTETNTLKRDSFQIDLDTLLSFAKNSAEEYNLEEERTCFVHSGYISEDHVRIKHGIPPRGIYSIPTCEMYILKESMDQQIRSLRFSLPTYYSTGLLMNQPSFDDVRMFPFKLKLKYEKNQAIVKNVRQNFRKITSKPLDQSTAQNILLLLREIFSIPEPKFTEELQTHMLTPHKRSLAVTSSDTDDTDSIPSHKRSPAVTSSDADDTDSIDSE